MDPSRRAVFAASLLTSGLIFSRADAGLEEDALGRQTVLVEIEGEGEIDTAHSRNWPGSGPAPSS